MIEPQRKYELHSLDDLAGPARPISDQRAHALVRGALRRVIAGEAEARPRLAPPARRLSRVALVAGGLLLAGAAVAGLVVSGLGMAIGRKAATPAPAPIQEPQQPIDESPSGAVASPEAATTAPAMAAPDDVRPTAAHLPARRRAAAAHAKGLAHAESDAPAAVGKDADDLLARANQLRGQRRWREAAAAYQAVIAGAPDSHGAYVAMLARAELLLDHLGHPAEALGLFQRALAEPSGVLTEEAHYGIASSYRALGDVENERRALNVFLAAHPHSLMRASAAARLGELH